MHPKRKRFFDYLLWTIILIVVAGTVVWAVWAGRQPSTLSIWGSGE